MYRCHISWRRPIIIAGPRRYPAKRSSRILAWFNQRRLNRLPVVCLPLKLKQFRLNFSDNDIFPAFTRDFRIFVFAILLLSLPFFFSAVHRKKSSKNARRKEEEKQWERAHCTQSVEAAAAKRNATKRIRRRSIASTVIGGGRAKKKLSLRCQRQLIWPRSRQEVAPPHSLSPTHTHTRTYMHSVWRTLWVEIECLDVQHGRRQSHKTHHRERERADGVC